MRCRALCTSEAKTFKMGARLEQYVAIPDASYEPEVLTVTPGTVFSIEMCRNHAEPGEEDASTCASGIQGLPRRCRGRRGRKVTILPP